MLTFINAMSRKTAAIGVAAMLVAVVCCTPMVLAAQPPVVPILSDEVCTPPRPADCSGGGVLQTNIASPYTATGCNSLNKSVTIHVGALAPTAAPAVPIFIACGRIDQMSALEVRGADSLAALAGVPPTVLTMQHMTLMEAMVVLYGQYQEGTVVTLRGNSVRRFSGDIARNPYREYGILIALEFLILNPNTIVEVVENYFESNFYPLASFCISQAGDTIMREQSTFRFANNYVLLEKSGEGYGSHAMLTTISSAPGRLVMTGSFALSEFRGNVFNATCQVGFLSMWTLIQNGTIRVMDNSSNRTPQQHIPLTLFTAFTSLPSSLWPGRDILR